jgi:hypothetical protein
LYSCSLFQASSSCICPLSRQWSYTAFVSERFFDELSFTDLGSVWKSLYLCFLGKLQNYEKPIDSAQDILDRGMIPFIIDGGDYLKDHLLQSSNPVYQKLGEIVIVPKDYDQYEKMMKEDILVANTHVYLGALDNEERSWGKFHESKDVLEGENPFFGDIVNKKWSLGEEYSYHLLLLQQVDFCIQIKLKKFLIEVFSSIVIH